MHTWATKRKRIPEPSISDYPDIGCTDEDAHTALEPTLAWVLEADTDEKRADRVSFFYRLLFYKANFDSEKAKNFQKLQSDRLPSFSDIKWDDLAGVYCLGSTFMLLPKELQDVQSVPTCVLPLSIHRRLKFEGWIKMDVNGDVGLVSTEASKVNIGAYAIEGVVSLFSGRMINRSEESLPKTSFSSGGRVEYQLYVFGGVLVIVAEFKRSELTNNHAAQLFAEMIAAVENNAAAQQRVHGMLSNLDYHYFFSYDPSQKRITQGRKFATGALTRLERLESMVYVINHLFSLCLDSMREFVLNAKILSAKRHDRETTSSANPKDVAELPVPPHSPDVRKSLPSWEQTYDLLCEAQKKLQFPDDMEFSTEAINSRGEEGLSLLNQAMDTLPRLSSLEDGLGPKSYAEVIALIDKESEQQELAFIFHLERKRKREREKRKA
ncbi:hypothetical protein B0H11DRAFT_1953384 [Mycena galericulata]|nr:hypothetical protein B0H11DRAFT_1953384 [Mycena galericulata]